MAQQRPAAEFALHLPQFAGLLESSKRTDNGIEQKQEDEQAILIHVEIAVASLIAPNRIAPDPLYSFPF
jgi:hypothetical protein